jgi:hypothetical protein
MRSLYPALALFLVLAALRYLTTRYFSAGTGKPVNTG